MFFPGTSENTRVLPEEVVVVNMIALAVIKGVLRFLISSAINKGPRYVINKGSRYVFGAKPQANNPDTWILRNFNIVGTFLGMHLLPWIFVPEVIQDHLGLSGLIGLAVSDVSLEAAHFLAMIKPFSPE